MTDLMSTGRRRELGAELRRIREICGYNGVDMAARLRWSSTMLSRAEAGKRPMSEIEVASYTGLCGVAGEELRELLGLAGEPDDYRLKPHTGQIPDELRSLIFHESTASEIEVFEPIYIPGITQTPEYARALIEETGLADPVDIDRWIAVRMARQDVLTRINPARCTLYVHEHALRATIGGPQVMHEQMLNLLFASSRPQCAIRVVPASAGGRGMALGPFHIFSYPEDPPVVYLEHETTSEFLENGRELLSYRSVLNRLASVALDDAHSRECIATIASEYERQGAAQDEDGAGGSAGLAQE